MAGTATRLSYDLLKQQGYCAYHYAWNGISGVLEHLKIKPSYTGHVYASGDQIPRSLEESLAQTRPNQNAGYSCYKMEDVMTAPRLLDFVLSFDIAARTYFQEEPRLYSVNAFWKKPGADADWHFDQDDRKIMVLFMYGTDILTMDDGPHSYVSGTHLWSYDQKDMMHKSGAQPAKSLVHDFYGPAGTYFLTDTNGMHVGYSPKTKPRLLFWARWGVSNPPHAYTEDKLCPIPASKLPIKVIPSSDLQRRTSLVIDWTA